MYRVKIFSILLLCLIGVFGYAQNPYYYKIDKAKGLPSNSVYDVFQDSIGYMWFSTDEGLCRYNGTSFKSYYSTEQTSKSGSYISQDKYGRIWYSNFDGYLYYVQNEKLNALNNKNPAGYFSYGITDKYLHLITKKNIAIYNLENLRIIKNIPYNKSLLSASGVFGNKYYVLTSLLHVIDENNQESKITLPIDFYKYLGQSIIMQSTNEGILFISKLNGCNYLLKLDGSFVRQTRPHQLNFIQNVTFTDNSLWLATPKGIYKSLSQHNYQPFFSNFNISSVFKDKNSNFWFTTLNNGVLLVSRLQNILLEIQPRPIRINDTKNGLIVSTEDEKILSLDLENYSQKVIYKGETTHAINQFYFDSTSNYTFFTSNRFIILDKNNRLLNTTSAAVKDVKRIDDTYFSFAASNFSGIFKIGPQHKASIWDSIYTSKFSKSNTHFADATIFPNTNGKSTAYNPSNRTIYYATNSGLVYQTIVKQGEIRYKQKSVYLRTLENFQSKIYGLSTNNKVFMIDSSNRITHLPLSNSEGPIRINKIKLIGASLYLTSSKAVYEYNIKQQKIVWNINLGSDDEVTDIAIKNDDLLLATAKGVLKQNRNENKNQNHPKFVIEGIWVNDSLTVGKDLQELKYWQNNVSLKYSILSYAPNEKVAAYYQINSGKWQVLAQNIEQLNLSSLAPGKYTVRFKLAHPDTREQSISFEIAKPFWLTNLFIASIGVLLIILVYLIYRHQINQNNEQNAKELARVELEKNLNLSKLKAIKSQMNPHFFYNALNTIQSYILASEKKHALSYLSKFSALTRTILEMSESEYINLRDEIKMIGFYLDIEKARFNDDFDYKIETQNLGADEDLRIPSLLLQPYIENAIKHGLLHKEGSKELTVSFEKKDDILQVIIDDNGIGREKSAELNQIKNKSHRSFATAATQNRIDLLNEESHKKITISYIDKKNLSGLWSGTTVILQIPIN
jgi:ligand-binding sensor domain-containing protein